jgi:dihydroorotate dehydrogenase
MYRFFRFFLFKLDAETAHHFSLNALNFVFKIPFAKSILQLIYSNKNKRLERKLFGITFKNPVGLAAGLDKNAICINALSALGFGFIEIGTVTPMPQAGNEKPRLFRIIPDEAIINRMGFNNDGAKLVKENIEKAKKENAGIIIGGNIGKNKITANEEASSDYIKCFHALYNVVDYFVVNISSPNTANLRDLQDKEPLIELLSTLQNENNAMLKPKPILLKIAPDLNHSQLDDIIEVVSTTKIDGIIASNTTTARLGLSINEKEIEKIGSGGLSGKPLTQKSTEIIQYIHQKTEGKLPIIAVGGIMTAKDAIDKINAGASLVQIYTGFIYNGPKLIKDINNAILQRN